MSRIHKEHLQAGYIFGDPHNSEYLYLPVPYHRSIYTKTM